MADDMLEATGDRRQATGESKAERQTDRDRQTRQPDMQTVRERVRNKYTDLSTKPWMVFL